MLNRLDNVGAVLRATDNFCGKFHAFLAHLVDLVYHVFHGRAVYDNAIGSFAERAEHGRNAKAEHETKKGCEPGHIEEGPQIVAHLRFLYLTLGKYSH